MNNKFIFSIYLENQKRSYYGYNLMSLYKTSDITTSGFDFDNQTTYLLKYKRYFSRICYIYRNSYQ